MAACRTSSSRFGSGRSRAVKYAGYGSSGFSEVRQPHMRIILILFFACSLVRADPAAELKFALARLGGRNPVKVRVEFQSSGRVSDVGRLEGDGGKATALVEDGPEGMRVFWSRALVEQVAGERKVEARDPDKPSATGRAMDELMPAA